MVLLAPQFLVRSSCYSLLYGLLVNETRDKTRTDAGGGGQTGTQKEVLKMCSLK